MITDLIADGPDPLKPDEYRDALRCVLLRNYCEIMDYKNDAISFLNRKTITVGACMSAWLPNACATTTENYWHIPYGLTETYTDDQGADITVKGVILSVEKQTLQTSSLIADALLGRGEALDCFNQKAQDAESMSALIGNMAAMQSVQDSIQNSSVNLDIVAKQLEMTEKEIEVTSKRIDQMQSDIDIASQQMDVITAITDPADQATAYKKVFGSCCPTPQYTGGCGCGGGCGE